MSAKDLIAAAAITEEATTFPKGVVDVAIHQTTMQDLVHAANELVDIIDRLADLKAQTSELEAREKELKRSIIPDLMKNAGIVNSQNKGSFTVPGRRIYLETRTYASVTAEQKPTFFAWLRDHEQGAMIQETVNSQTLSAFVRERRADGLNDPPGIAVHEDTVAKVMKAK